MGVSDMFNSQDPRLSEEARKWNKMWDLWVQWEVESPYRELMTYQSEVYNGGHYQYFTNTEAIFDMRKELAALSKILPLPLWITLRLAYKGYLFLEKHPGKEYPVLSTLVEGSEMVFYLYEERINRILEAYAATIEL